MTHELERQSRRALIASGVAAVAGHALLGPSAQAADGEPVLQGRENRSTDVTAIMKGTPGGAAIMGFMQVHGSTATLDGIGVHGKGNDAGVVGTSIEGVGVEAQSDFVGLTAKGLLALRADGEEIAVDATCHPGVAVKGRTGGEGIGIQAIADAVDAEGKPAGTALRVDGKASFARSGVATVPAKTSTVTVSGVALTADSLIIATAQDTNGGGVRAALPDPTSNSFRIQMFRRVTGSSRVAWFVLE